MKVPIILCHLNIRFHDLHIYCLLKNTALDSYLRFTYKNPERKKKKETNNSSLVVLRYNHCKWIKRYILFSTHKIPVAPAVPAVSLVPPAFPVSMPVPPPGFSPIPPPPFLRASFNPSQPPPGKKLSSYYFNSI